MSDPANYFIVESNHTLSAFIEKVVEKTEEVQAAVFGVVEYVIMGQGYVPTAELTSIGLLLNSTE